VRRSMGRASRRRIWSRRARSLSFLRASSLAFRRGLSGPWGRCLVRGRGAAGEASRISARLAPSSVAARGSAARKLMRSPSPSRAIWNRAAAGYHWRKSTACSSTAIAFSFRTFAGVLRNRKSKSMVVTGAPCSAAAAFPIQHGFETMLLKQRGDAGQPRGVRPSTSRIASNRRPRPSRSRTARSVASSARSCDGGRTSSSARGSA
jgi:hypothetical protein